MTPPSRSDGVLRAHRVTIDLVRGRHGWEASIYDSQLDADDQWAGRYGPSIDMAGVLSLIAEDYDGPLV